jgi:hypothetical protein
VKRKLLADRAALLNRLQQELTDAARLFAKRDADPAMGRGYVEEARKDLTNAALRYGLACKRYLGGRE